MARAGKADVRFGQTTWERAATLVRFVPEADLFPLPECGARKSISTHLEADPRRSRPRETDSRPLRGDNLRIHRRPRDMRHSAARVHSSRLRVGNVRKGPEEHSSHMLEDSRH